MADAVPITETDTVGELLQNQDRQDKDQFVFLSEADANMDTVSQHLDDLTKHIKALSMGQNPDGEAAGVHGPQLDQPKMVAVEPAGDGLFRLMCSPEPFPHVSRMVANLLSGLTMVEVAELFDMFKGKILTRAGVERVLECYVLTKRSKADEEMLKQPHNQAKTKFGIGYADLKVAGAGAPMQWICPKCMAPRPKTMTTCPLQVDRFAHSLHRAYTARMRVDEVDWEKRVPHWHAPGVTDE